MIHCVTCHSFEFPGALFCGSCGDALPYFVEGMVASAGDKAVALRGFPMPLSTFYPALIGQNLKVNKEVEQLRFVIGDSGRPVTVKLDGPILIGRQDSDAGIFPQLDLTADQGEEQGVSRRHALIQLTNAGVTVTDLNSTNGTLLNSCFLPSELPYSLQDGDQLYIGDLLLYVYFE